MVRAAIGCSFHGGGAGVNAQHSGPHRRKEQQRKRHPEKVAEDVVFLADKAAEQLASIDRAAAAGGNPVYAVGSAGRSPRPIAGGCRLWCGLVGRSRGGLGAGESADGARQRATAPAATLSPAISDAAACCST